MISRRATLAMAILATLLCLAPFASAQQTARAKALGLRVKCMCGGCNDAAGACYHSGGEFSGPCEAALGMLKEIDQRVARNESDDEILKAFVKEYGPTVLMEPPKSGFDLTAWIMPVAVPLIAFIAVWEVVRRWRRRAALLPPAPDVPADLLARVHHEAGRDES